MSSSISSFEIQRFAVKYEPPTFVIEYKNKANGKIFVKKIRLRRIDGVNANQLTDKIISANLELLGPENVCKEQIFELISKMLTHLNDVDQRNSSESLKISHKVAKNYGDLNKADDMVVIRAKQDMDVGFEANRIQPDSKDFVWDKQANFEPPVGASEWDEDD